MRKTISILLAASAVLPLFWFRAMPAGESFCASSVSFRPATDGSYGLKAAANAKSSFCRTVASYPIR